MTTRREFLKISGVAAMAGLVKADQVQARNDEDGYKRTHRRYYHHLVYPLITDFKGLQVIDPHAAEEYRKGWEQSELRDGCRGDTLDETTGEVKEGVFERHCREDELRFALTPNKGWDSRSKRHDCLGYNPVYRYWTFYEYDVGDGRDIFGRDPKYGGFDPAHPHICFHWTEEERAKHEAHVEEQERKFATREQ